MSHVALPTHGLLLDIQDTITPTPRRHYVDYAFDLPGEWPESIAKLTVHLHFFKPDGDNTQLFMALYDPNGFRGMRMNPGATGQVDLTLWVAPDDASEGAIPGSLPTGTWRVRVDVNETDGDMPYHLEVQAEPGPATQPWPESFPEGHVVKSEAGWYRGELHAHSTESDGKQPVAEVVEAARQAHLDFFALTDHFTVSQWRKLVPFAQGDMALLRSCELTSHHGHANLHGLQQWVNVYVDQPEWSMNDAADAIHAQGGLFCVNHAFSGRLGWRAYDFDWAKADLMEVYHNLEGANNHLQLPLWDRLLAQGYRIVGVGGIDAHDLHAPLHKLGQLVTWVYAEELSEAGILAGLRRGQVFVSRGPRLRFHATNHAGESVDMWESIPSDARPVEFSVQVESDKPLRLFVLRDGLPFDMWKLDRSDAGSQTITFVDTPLHKSYYRLELHDTAANEQYKGIQWRDYASFQACSNPIWINA